MLAAVAALSFRCGIHRRDSCEAAYQKYLKCYPEKSFSQEGQDMFCSTFAVLIRPNCTSCDVTPVMDQKFHPNARVAQRTEPTDTCVDGCKLDYPYKNLSTIMTPL